MTDVPPKRANHPLVCFDLGGVLVHICHTWREAYLAAGLEIRRLPSSPAFDARFHELTEQLDTGAISVAEWANAVSRVGEGAYTAEEMNRVHYAVCQSERQGALALIDDLHNAGVVTGCLSNTNAPHWIRLMHRDESGPLDGPPHYPAVMRLMHRLASHLLHLAKPDAAIYQEFERQTGVSGRDILFFDDRPENVAAALTQGWRAERIDPTGDTILQMRTRLKLEGVL